MPEDNLAEQLWLDSQSTSRQTEIKVMSKRPDVLEAGVVLKRRSLTGQRYYLYLPTTLEPDSPLLVTIHGISCKASEQTSGFQNLAKRYSTVILSPLYRAGKYRDFQRLGRDGHGPRSDLELLQLLTEVRSLIGLIERPFYLFGFSGGGQFAHRFTMVWPDQVAGLAIGAAGWYTFPDDSVLYPCGIAKPRKLSGVRFELKSFLRIPTCVYVGEHDITRDDELRKSASLDRQQGMNRLLRGRRWISVMRSEASKHGILGRFRFEILPATGHSFTQAIRTGSLADRLFDFFLGSAKSVPSFVSIEDDLHHHVLLSSSADELC